jgi:hypothetical protein
MEGIAPDQPPERAATGPRPEPGAGGGVVCGGRGQDRPRPVTAPSVGMAKPRQVHREALGPRGRGAACRPSGPMRWVGDRLAHRREVIRTRGLVEVREPRRARPPARPTASAQLPGRPPGGGRAVGLREPTATAQDRARGGIARVVCGVAPLAGRQVEGRPQHPGKPCVSAEVGAPGPRCPGMRPRRPGRPDRGPCA